MRKISFLALFITLAFFMTSVFIFAEDSKNVPAPVVKSEKSEPFLWDLIFSNTKTVVPMVSTSIEIALSPYGPGFIPKTDVISNKSRYTSGDRLLVQNHFWNEGDTAGSVDYYVIVFDYFHPEIIFFWRGADFNTTAFHQFVNMKVGFDKIDTIFDFHLPANPPAGKYVFAAGLAASGTTTFYSIDSLIIEIY
jgi:hypothetical protein